MRRFYFPQRRYCKDGVARISFTNLFAKSVDARLPARPKSALNSENSAEPLPLIRNLETSSPLAFVATHSRLMKKRVGGHVSIESELDDVEISGVKTNAIGSAE